MMKSNNESVETVVVHMNEAVQSPPDFFTGTYTATTIYNNATKLPLAQARNQGARIAQSTRLIFLDVDCVPATNFVKDYISAFETAPDAISMGTVFYLSVPLSEGWQDSDLVKMGQPHPLRYYPNVGVLHFTQDYHLFWSLNFGLCRSVWERSGGFDEQFLGYGAEDTDFALTIKSQSVRLAWLRGGTAFHQQHEQYLPPLQHFHDIVRNSIIFYRKWQRWPMEKWLQQFAEAGYITWSADASTLSIMTEPTSQAIAAARQLA